ncbi:MAG: APC family permease [Cyclobacteriaceae bacterium]|jgi:APA family basic amino acid/polyamine antiporter|nr:APC family permease [Cyclobacteriaceae bacterium]
MNPHSNLTVALPRKLGLLGLAATGICSMIGASIYVVPFMIQRNVPGIGPYVLLAFLFAAIPATLAAFAYIILASAMPRAGGSYIYASRSLSPYLGFVASFSQWFGLSIAIGVVSYVIVPFLRDIATAMLWNELASWLNTGIVRVSLSLIFLWTFVLINIKGVKLYERTVVPLMILMFGLGAIVIVTGLSFDKQDFAQALMLREGRSVVEIPAIFNWKTFLAGSALLFSSFIGFDSIAQAGGEAKDPSCSLPRAIGIAMISVSLFYILFTFSVYHTIPWSFVAAESLTKDITAVGLLSYLLSPGWAVLIVLGAAIALINDLPAMILSVSRLMFSWAEDGIFPKRVSKIHRSYHTPYVAILLSGVMATIGILGSHFAGDFFLGIDIMVTSMLVNFLLMCISVLVLPKTNPALAANIKVFKSVSLQRIVASAGALWLTGFLLIHITKDLTAPAQAWYFHSTPIWFLVMIIASLIFVYNWKRLKKSGVDTQQLFSTLPPE